MIIGITGNSGTGKTYISKMLSEIINYKIINADEVVSDLYNKKSEYYNEVVKCFGKEILEEDLSISRKVLAEKIFNKPEEKAKLDNLTYEYVAREIKKRVENNSIIDAPLLFESGLNKICDITIAVLCEGDTKINRICKRDNLTKEEAIKRLKAQNEDSYYKQRADFIIYNNDENEVEYQLEEIISVVNNK